MAAPTAPQSQKCPCPRNVPAAEMSLALACPAAGLSLLCQVLGMSVAGNPAGNLKEAQTGHKTAGGRAHLLAPNSEQAPGTGGHAASAREVWPPCPCVAPTGGDKSHHLPPDATTPKQGKPDML